jgi:signal transduction histidine kinase
MSAVPFSPPDRATRIGVVALTVVIFAAGVAFVTMRLRRELRQQLLDREAAMLRTVASMQLAEEAAAAGGMRLPGASLAAVLRASKLEGVLALALFDEQRSFVLAGAAAPDEDPSDAEWKTMLAGGVIARVRPADAAGAALNPAVPIVEAWVPLRENETAPIAGAAHFLVNGRAIAREFAALDRRLGVQALLAWLAGSAVIVTTLAWTFRRLEAANRELRLHSENLQRANRELVLAAKTSALGSVTAHLLHALKNPIAGLEVFVASRAENGAAAEGGEDLAAATELTRRLRTMVNDVVSVLRDEQSGADFELSCDELVEIALAKARPLAAARGVRLLMENSSPHVFPSRRAQLAGLALYNLLQNAIEATPRGAVVRLTARPAAGVPRSTELVVADEGPGLPAAVRERLFQPCVSSKVGGSGLGLALSQQLARHAGGRIELLRSDAAGTHFRLVLDPGS